MEKLTKMEHAIIDLNGGKVTTKIEDKITNEDIKLPPPGIVKVNKPDAAPKTNTSTQLAKV